MQIGIGLSLTQPRGGGGFSPLSLFAAGEQGAWYDPSDITTLFQDAAGTTPVTATGQPVGKMLDKSGRGNHLTQATGPSRPIYTVSGGLSYLAFDGVDDYLGTASIPFAGQQMAVWAGVQKRSDLGANLLLETGATVGNPGTFAISSPDASQPNYGFYGNAGAQCGYVASTYTAPVTNVLSLYLDFAGALRTDEVFPRVNGVTPTLSGGLVGPCGAGSFVSNGLYIGCRNGSTFFLNGCIYQIIIRNAASTPAQIAQGETYTNTKTQAY